MRVVHVSVISINLHKPLADHNHLSDMRCIAPYRFCTHIRQRWSDRPELIIFVDNCYGEFVEDKEPIAIGADLIAGSLIKNPGMLLHQATHVKSTTYELHYQLLYYLYMHSQAHWSCNCSVRVMSWCDLTLLERYHHYDSLPAAAHVLKPHHVY
jgi:Methionine gamma-lyase